MTLYDFLSKLKSDIKVKIWRDGVSYTTYSDSLELLDEEIKQAQITEWEVTDRVSVKVVLENIISG